MREAGRTGLIGELRKELPLFVRFSLLVFLVLLLQPYAIALAREQAVPGIVICVHGGVVADDGLHHDDGGDGTDCAHCFLCRGHTTSVAGLPPAPPLESLVPEHDASAMPSTFGGERPDDLLLLRPPVRAPPPIA